MKLFSKLYDLALRWAAHRHAPVYLGILSFAESSFFPVPPDVMLAPMALARRNRAWFYAGITTLASVMGGMLGYVIGQEASQQFIPFLQDAGFWSDAGYKCVSKWFNDWGFWAVFLAGFTPIPYKIFTISAGAIGMPFLPFVVASTIGRGGRFFIVAGIIFLGGEKMEQTLRRYMEILGWSVLVLLVAAYFAWTRWGGSWSC